MKTVSEGSISVRVGEGVFYNPEMELCRDLSSHCLGALAGKFSVADAMCASGIRGLRYAAENKNVSSLALSDQSMKAVGCARKNAKALGIKCSVRQEDANRLLFEGGFDFVELDPFGSPAPFIHSAARCLSFSKSGCLSVTATDMAVLCGAEHSACMRNYGAVPLDNEFCHENAARILSAKVMLACAPFNLAASPVFTLSHRHYLKMVFEVKRDSKAATERVKSLGFVSYCPKCCFRSISRFSPERKCPHCRHQMEIAGPMSRESLWRPETLKKMLSLNSARGFAKSGQAKKLLECMVLEAEVGAFAYYDLHVLAKKTGGGILSMDGALERLKGAGYRASRTHFSPTSVRTDAPHDEVLRLAVK